MSSRTSALDYDVQKIAAALAAAAQQFDAQMRKIDTYRKRSVAAADGGLFGRLNRAFARPASLPRGVDAGLTTFNTSLGYLASIEADCGHQPLMSADDADAQRRLNDWQHKSDDVRATLLARVQALPQWRDYQSRVAARGLSAEVTIVQREVPTSLAGAVLHEDVMMVRLPLAAPAAALALVVPRSVNAHSV